MARNVGRPPRPISIDSDLLEATHRALLKLAKELGLSTGRYPDAATGGYRSRPKPLAVAVLALEAQEALEVLAAQEVELAREHDDVSWADISEAFGITTQSAHHRFARR
jgi:hypothetical protein